MTEPNTPTPGVPPVIDVPPLVSRVLPPPPPRVWTVFVMFVLVLGLVVSLSAVLLAAVTIALHGTVREEHVEATFANPVVLLCSLGFTLAMLLGAAIAGAWLSPTPWRQRLRWQPRPG